ncbi:low temperature requirement protein A [uncultured Streptococcus sp.]|uniref:low temperature requirement protein A n=1 Tax=uncultured Streptococcus sp. TaxID=83427 RepID=UPI0027DD4237|nr:low temperature requirement protein A [uncultured Streptococcus sp.]
MHEDIKTNILSLSLSALVFAVLTAIYILTPALHSNSYFFILWILPTFIPWVLARNFDHHLINFPHLVERCQLITIITYGEAVLAIIRSYPMSSQALLGFLIFVGLSFMFISYISQTYLNINHHQVTRANALALAHLVLITDLNIFTVSAELWADSHHREWGMVLFVIGLVMYYASLMLLTVYNDASLRLHKYHYLAYVVISILGLSLVVLFNSSRLIAVLFFVAMAYAYNRIGYIHRVTVRRKLAKKLAARKK